MHVVEIHSRTDLRSQSGGGVVQEEEITAAAGLIVVEAAALLRRQFPALLHTFLDAAAGGLDHVEVALSLGQGGVDRSNSLQVAASRALLLFQVAGDVKVVDQEVISLGDEEIRLRGAGLRVQDTFLLVVVVHDGFTDEVVSGLGRRTENVKIIVGREDSLCALIQAHGDRGDILHNEGREADEDLLLDSGERRHISAGVGS